MLDEKANEWKKIPLDVAVIGGSGVGKSSYINAIRGMTADDEGAAPVAVTETTTEVRSFPHPDNEMLRLWDLPGFGTKKFSRENYLAKIEVDRFDFFLLMTANRFRADDIWLIDELRKQGKKYFFVRTKIAEDVANNKKAHPHTHSEEEVVTEIRESTATHLKEEGCDNVPIFLIDNYELQKFEFKDLKMRLIEDFPELKKSALVFTLQATSERIIRLKVDELRARIWTKSALSTGVALVPVPGLSLGIDLAIVVSEANFYFKQLGLDNESLQRYCRQYSLDYDKVRSIVDSALGIAATDTSTTAVRRIVIRSKPLLTATAAEEGVRFFLPVIGSFIAAPTSFGGTYLALKLVLDKFEETAIEVMKFVAKNAANAKESGDSAEDTNGIKTQGNSSRLQKSVSKDSGSAADNID